MSPLSESSAIALARPLTLGLQARRRRAIAQYEAAAGMLLANPPTVGAYAGIARMLPVWLRWRAHPVGAVMAAAARHPRRTALVDDEGSLTFAEFDARSNGVARAWRDRGIGPGTTVGVLCRDGRFFFDAAHAAQKLGANLVYLNTHFSAPQVAGVVDDEGIDLLAHDASLESLVEGVDAPAIVAEDELRAAAEAGDRRPLRPPPRPGRVVVLTSGTTGRPKGAGRTGVGGVAAGASVVASVPLLSGDTAVVAAPLFHGFGLFGSSLSLALSSTVVVRPRFDAEQVLADIAANRARVLVVVPIMLERILALPRRVTECYDVSSLRVVLCGGAALSGDLAGRFMDRFGDVLYNVYGSTESGFATVGYPKDLRKAPGTAGRPGPGAIVRVVDAEGRDVPPGVTGRVVVGSALRMEGYTGGDGKESVDGLVVTGDLGHFDGAGRLFIDGREDDMIISGGENVFPAEVEEVLGSHPAVAEAAVIGVDDAEFGQRLRAFVVRAPHAAVDGEELKEHVHDRLARFKTPRDVVFVDSLPRTGTGKVLKRELRKR